MQGPLEILFSEMLGPSGTLRPETQGWLEKLCPET